MDIEAAIENSGLRASFVQLRKKQFSDIVDSDGLQYVDIVMEGGGMLGIALVGYTWALEQAGIRFLGIGGTSAGAINALLLAAIGNPSEEKSPKLLNELGNINFFEFVDGGQDSRDFVEAYVKKAGKIKLAFKGAQVIDSIFDNLGLNPGDAFLEWIQKLLRQEGISKWSQLRDRLKVKPTGLRLRNGDDLSTDFKGARLAIVAADVSTETKVIFPDDAKLYFKDPNSVDPALFVRASMSVPFFFEPLRIEDLPIGEEAKENWACCGYDTDIERGGMPDHAIFIDGGIMSNFPIDVFHVYDRIPRSPTFGVKLQYDNKRHLIDSPAHLLSAIFSSARHCLDYDFIHKNPDYEKLVQWIPCQKYSWLDFNMSSEDKAGLFVEGARRAIEFLNKFDWNRYKETRAAMLAAHH